MPSELPMPPDTDQFVSKDVFSGFAKNMGGRLDAIEEAIRNLANGRGTNWSVLLTVVAMMSAAMIFSVTVYVEPMKVTIAGQQDALFRLFEQQLKDAEWRGNLNARVKEDEHELDLMWELWFTSLKDGGIMEERTQWLMKP